MVCRVGNQFRTAHGAGGAVAGGGGRWKNCAHHPTLTTPPTSHSYLHISIVFWGPPPHWTMVATMPPAMQTPFPYRITAHAAIPHYYRHHNPALYARRHAVWTDTLPGRGTRLTHLPCRVSHDTAHFTTAFLTYPTPTLRPCCAVPRARAGCVYLNAPADAAFTHALPGWT